jgi:hypothetical protein
MNFFLKKKYACEEPFLVHVIDVPRLYVVLSDFRGKEFERVTIAILNVSLNASAVHPDAPFAAEVCRVSAKKRRNPAFRTCP